MNSLHMRRSRSPGLCALLVLGGLLAACSDPEPAPAGEDAFWLAKRAVSAFRTYPAANFHASTTYLAPPAGGLAFAPDARSLLVTTDASGVFNAAAVDRVTGSITVLTDSTTAATFAQSYFPADGRILYTRDGSGDELDHLLVREEDGSARDLTPGERVKARFMGWLDDGSAFFVATNERDPQAFDLYRYATDGYARTLVHRNDAGRDLSGVSGDGRHLILTDNRSSADNDLWLVDLITGAEPRLLTPHDGDVSHGFETFHPDGSRLVFTTDAHGEFRQAWTHDLETGAQRPLVISDWDVQGAAYSHTGRYRVTYVNVDAVTLMELTDVRSETPIPMPGIPEGDILSVRFSADDRYISFLVNGDTRPSDVFVVHLDAPAGQRSVRRYTDALDPAIDRGHLVEGEVVRYRSFDGLEIPAILYRPRQASAQQPVPAVVFVHGGPGGQTTKGYSATIQHLVNHGYAVLGANNRGSSGYGKTFHHLDDRRHGEDDLRDIVEAHDYLASLDWIDGERIGVMGGSYGGFMTAAALAFHPEVFDVGIDIFGVTNWERTLQSIPPWWGAFRDSLHDEMGDPATDAERHRRISPLFQADAIARPLLVVQGANDPRVLQAESDELVAAVRENEVPVEYLLFEDEGHGFRRRSNRIEASEAYLRFLNTWLKRDE